MLSVTAYFKDHWSKQKGEDESLSQKEMTVYEVTVYIFTWRKKKYDCSKSLGTEKWAASLSPFPSLFVPLPLTTSNRGNICGIHFWECYNSSQWLEPVQYARQCLMWTWSPFSDCYASSTPPACALSNAIGSLENTSENGDFVRYHWRKGPVKQILPYEPSLIPSNQICLRWQWALDDRYAWTCKWISIHH